MIFIYIIIFGIVCVIIKKLDDSKIHNIRIKAGHKSYATRLKNIKYLPVDLMGKKYNIRRSK